MLHSIAIFISLLILFSSTRASPQPTPDISLQFNKAEQWALRQISSGHDADLNTNCGNELDSNTDDSRWNDKCRSISAIFIKSLLTSRHMQSSITHYGVHIIGANIIDTIDLSHISTQFSLEISSSRFHSGIMLNHARFGGTVSFQNSYFKSGFFADSLRVNGSLLVREKAVIRGPFHISGGRIEGNVELTNSVFANGIQAEGVRISDHLLCFSCTVETTNLNISYAVVGGDIQLNDSRLSGGLLSERVETNGRFLLRNAYVQSNPTVFVQARVKGDIDFSGTRFEGALDASGLMVGSQLKIGPNSAVSGALYLAGSKVVGDVTLEGSNFSGGISAYSMDVGKHIFIKNGSVKNGPLELLTTTIGGDLDLSDSVFDSSVDLSRAQIKGNLFLANSRFNADYLRLYGVKIGNNIDMARANMLTKVDIDGSFIDGSIVIDGTQFSQMPYITSTNVRGIIDLNDAKLPSLDLSSTIIGQELRVGRDQPVTWKSDSTLILVNTRVRVISAAIISDVKERCATGKSWPDKLVLQGFSYDVFWSVDAVTKAKHLPCWYIGWLERDNSSYDQSFRQLASVLKAKGETDNAEEILYRSKDRELARATEDGSYFDVIGLYSLKYIIGYGIGSRIFIVIFWVFGFTIIGITVLLASQTARRKGIIWCAGASLDHLLPIVELNKEFGDFFNDPTRKDLKSWQIAYFSIHTLIGYLLASFLVVGLSGLTQTS